MRLTFSAHLTILNFFTIIVFSANPGGLAKAQLCSRMSVGIEGSNPDESMVIRPFCLLCFGLCNGLITRSEKSYRVCVCVCVFYVSKIFS